MADEAPDPEPDELVSRTPLEEGLVALCRRLNELGARYLVCGGFAIIQAGYPRFTGDIALLVDASRENERLVFQALEILPDKAVRQLDPGDLARHIVCRVADEVLVDLMASAGGIDYAEAARDIVVREVDGVPIPFASPRLLWRMKRHTPPRERPPGPPLPPPALRGPRHRAAGLSLSKHLLPTLRHRRASCSSGI